MSEIICLNSYKNMKNEQKQGDKSLDARIINIRKSITKINILMSELRSTNESQKKKGEKND